MPPLTLNDDALVAVLSHLETVGVVCASHVDKRWRAVAVGTASLWRAAVLDAKSLDDDSRFRTIVRRSGSALLEIHARIDSFYTFAYTGPAHFDLLLKTVASERRRIRVLNLHLGGNHLTPLSAVLAHGFPSLVALDIEVDDAMLALDDAPVLAFPRALPAAFAPGLERFSLIGTPLPPGFLLHNVRSVTVQLLPWTESAFETLFSSFPSMTVLSLWLGIDLPDLSSQRALELIQRIGNLDKLHIHKPWGEGPREIKALLTGQSELRARHFMLHEVVHAQHAAFSLVLQKLAAEERAELHATLSEAQTLRRPNSPEPPPPLYQVHVHCPTSGRTRAITMANYGFAVYAAVRATLTLDGCREVTVIGETGWRLLCSAHKQACLHHVQRLRIVLTALPLPTVHRSRRRLQLPALRNLVLRAPPDLGRCISVDAQRITELLRRVEVDTSATLDVQTICVKLHGKLGRWPGHVTLNGEDPNASAGARA